MMMARPMFFVTHLTVVSFVSSEYSEENEKKKQKKNYFSTLRGKIYTNKQRDISLYMKMHKAVWLCM